MSIKVRCECGQMLGEFEGKFDVRCRCKKIVKGQTVMVGAYEFVLIQNPDLPANEIRLRQPDMPDQIVKIGPNPWPKKLMTR